MVSIFNNEGTDCCNLRNSLLYHYNKLVTYNNPCFEQLSAGIGTITQYHYKHVHKKQLLCAIVEGKRKVYAFSCHDRSLCTQKQPETAVLNAAIRNSDTVGFRPVCAAWQQIQTLIASRTRSSLQDNAKQPSGGANQHHSTQS